MASLSFDSTFFFALSIDSFDYVDTKKLEVALKCF